MKIIHVVSGMDPKAGGISQAIRTMIGGLTDQGIYSEVVSVGPETANPETDDPFPIHFTGPGKSAWQFSAGLQSWLKNNLRHYDAVLVHGLWQYHTYAVYEAVSNMLNPPKIYVMPHGMLDPWFQQAKGREIKSLRNWLIWKFFEHRIINMADGIFFTCETERKLARHTFSSYYPKSEMVVGLGVHRPPLYSIEMQEAFSRACDVKGGGYLLFLGRIDAKKGVNLLVDAYLSLKSEGHDLPPLVIAGPGMDTPFGMGIKKQARYDQEIYFPGMLSGPAKWGAFYGCEAFLLPSHQENFGIAVVEAMACSRPVLISDQVNIWREIEHNGGGLVEKDTSDGIRNLLVNWLSLSQIDRARMSTQARKAFLGDFSVEKAAGKLGKVLS
ncbi:glycosyltransferase [Dyadobacter sp. CY351]|uniref:glycosyltransferase n=1 Tax=Dyadobacter sp. CY351 TaxID=2909337 RepID=UPI001F196DD0|nr:glycosyltransferase [Dyadobacter sp. CY351]MCF2519147.1 glycosyltransferase [Dyadobacter sp. CY351]